MSNTRKKLKINLTTSNCSSLQPAVVDNFTENEIPFHCHSEIEWPTVDYSMVTNFARYLLISLTTFLQLAKYWYPIWYFSLVLFLPSLLGFATFLWHELNILVVWKKIAVIWQFKNGTKHMCGNTDEKNCFFFYFLNKKSVKT